MHMCIFESSAYMYVSVCIWLYFAVHICMYLTVFWGHIHSHMHQIVVFIAPNRPPAATRHTRISHHHQHKRLLMIQIPIPGAGAVPTGKRRSSSQQENQSGARPAWKLQFGNHLRFVTVSEGLLYLTAERRVIFRGHDCLLPCAARRASLKLSFLWIASYLSG